MPDTYQWDELRKRTKQFAIRIVKLFRALPRRREAYVLGTQVLRSGTSVAANYRAVCRARSKAEFIFKIGVVLEEADETVFWSCSLKQELLSAPEWRVYSAKRMNCSPYLQLLSGRPGSTESIPE